MAVLRGCTSLVALLLALAGPALVLAFQLTTELLAWPSPPLTVELWFGVEIAVYIICPLLVLTVFGTVNYCKVSLTSRLLPAHQVQAIKLNIGVTILTNLAVFLFLVQECLALWLHQLEGRQEQQVLEVQALVTTGHLVAQAGVGLVLALLAPLYLCLTSRCCHGCCCPGINELEEVEVSYSPVCREERR